MSASPAQYEPDLSAGHTIADVRYRLSARLKVESMDLFDGVLYACWHAQPVTSVYILKTFKTIPCNRNEFLSRVSTLRRDIDIAILSVCLSVRLSVRNSPVSDENGITHCHSFFHHTLVQSF